MKIVVYTHVLQHGGAEKRATVYANYLYEYGYDVELVTMHGEDNEYFVQEGLPRHNVAKDYREYSKLNVFKRLNGLRKIFEDIKPDIIISFLPTFGFYAGLAVKTSKILRNKTKIVYSITLFQKKYSFTVKAVDFFAMSMSNAIALQCKEQEEINKKFKKKCLVCYNPIEDKWGREIQREYEKLSIIAVGRLTDQKNFNETIKAVAETHSINPNVSLDIFGSGEKKEELLKLIDSLDASSYIHLNDFSLKLNEEYEKHNVYISTSKYEGFPNSLAEAMMSGLVSISTPCPTGPREIIEDGVNGFLCKNSNEITKTLLKLLDDKKLCQLISKTSRESILNRFEKNKIMDENIKNIINFLK